MNRTSIIKGILLITMSLSLSFGFVVKVQASQQLYEAVFVINDTFVLTINPVPIDAEEHKFDMPGQLSEESITIFTTVIQGSFFAIDAGRFAMPIVVNVNNPRAAIWRDNRNLGAGRFPQQQGFILRRIRDAGGEISNEEVRRFTGGGHVAYVFNDLGEYSLSFDVGHGFGQEIFRFFVVYDALSDINSLYHS